MNHYVWDIAYIDAPVMRYHDADANGDFTDPGDDTRYYTYDANWNVTGAIDEDGTVLARYGYDPYGMATEYAADWTGGTAPSEDGPLYAGYFFDAETGLYHVRNRQYQADMGKFLQRDPIGYAAGDSNLTRYVGSSPLSATDPMGLAPPGRSGSYPRPRPPVRNTWTRPAVAMFSRVKAQLDQNLRDISEVLIEIGKKVASLQECEEVLLEPEYQRLMKLKKEYWNNYVSLAREATFSIEKIEKFVDGHYEMPYKGELWDHDAWRKASSIMGDALDAREKWLKKVETTVYTADRVGLVLTTATGGAALVKAGITQGSAYAIRVAGKVGAGFVGGAVIGAAADAAIEKLPISDDEKMWLRTGLDMVALIAGAKNMRNKPNGTKPDGSGPKPKPDVDPPAEVGNNGGNANGPTTGRPASGSNPRGKSRAGAVFPSRKVRTPAVKQSHFGPKIATPIPKKGVPKNWGKTDVENAIEDYRTSIASRKAELSAFDAAGGGSPTQRLAHARRITQEEGFLSSLEKALEDLR